MLNTLVQMHAAGLQPPSLGLVEVGLVGADDRHDQAVDEIAVRRVKRDLQVALGAGQGRAQAVAKGDIVDHGLDAAPRRL